MSKRVVVFSQPFVIRASSSFSDWDFVISHSPTLFRKQQRGVPVNVATVQATATGNAVDIRPEDLAGDTALTQRQKIAEASRQFEAILLRQVLSETQKTVIPSEFTDNSTASSVYQDMITTTLADSISKSGKFGLAKIFERQLSPTTPTPNNE
ncbi:MAG TPA: rod-binding protein [Candidatus Sulfopaludibacter sp.]|nr:rod-binding protein [Candidatus Sulfopaludibacter sp.]